MDEQRGFVPGVQFLVIDFVPDTLVHLSVSLSTQPANRAWTKGVPKCMR